MLRIGLTGGIGSGKSTVARLFEELGVPTIDTDQIARDLVQPGQPALAEITRTFGEEALTSNGELNRAYMRERIFTDPAARARLETILHPRIRAAVAKQSSELSSPYCIVSIPLLVERHWQKQVDRVLVIDTAPELQLTRTSLRDGISRQQAQRILDAQATREERLLAADDVIHNDGDLNALREQVTMLHQSYRRLAGAI